MSYKIKSEVIFGHDEKEILDKFAHTLSDKFDGYKLAGFNIQEFDNPQVLFKFMKHDCIGGNYIPLNKYDCIDMFQLLKDKEDLFPKLDKYLKAFGLTSKYNGYSGADVGRLYKEGLYDEIKKYSLDDAVVEMELFLRMSKFGYLSGHKQVNIYNTLVYDIEVIVDDESLPTKDIMLAKEIEKINKNKSIKKQDTKNRRIDEYSKELDTGEWKEKFVFNKMHNKIISISYSWLEYIKGVV